MLIYFDTNVFAHINEAGEEQAFVDWLAERDNRALLSYHHLWESLAIEDGDLRQRRIRLLRSIPCKYLDYPAYLEAQEFLRELPVQVQVPPLQVRPDRAQELVRLALGP